MRNIQKLFLCALAGAFTLLAGCGVHLNPATEAEQPVSLTGDWLLAGPLQPFSTLEQTPAPAPGLTLAADLFVSGDEVSAQGSYEIRCSPFGFATTFLASGKMADDGTFTITNPDASIFSDSVQITINGQAPNAASPAGWSGQYTVSYPPGSSQSSCGTQTASFIATPIPSLSGTFIGAASQEPSAINGIGSSAALSFMVTQGAPVLSAGTIPGVNPLSPESSIGIIPLSGTIAVTGSSCFVSGVTSGSQAQSSLTGSAYTVRFTMNDGSQLFLSGMMNDNSASSLSAFYNVVCGKCDKDGGETTLTRS